VRVLVVQRHAPTAAADREQAAAAVQRLLELPERPRVEQVPFIPLTPGGKLRTLVRES
jgi:hypothetical protein